MPTVMLIIAKKILILASVLALVWVMVLPPTAFGQATTVIGARETVRLITPRGEVEVVAKIDSGADYSSIDRELAISLGCEAGGKKMTISNGVGRDVRETTTITFLLAGRTITTTATLADRSKLSTPMLVGKQDMAGFMIDPSRQFLTKPEQTAGAAVPLFTGEPGIALGKPIAVGTYGLMEQASQNAEDPRLGGDAGPLLAASVANAVPIGLYGVFLSELSFNPLWIIFSVSIPAAVAAGYYLGRRTELFR